jgi:hypothetical protein
MTHVASVCGTALPVAADGETLPWGSPLAAGVPLRARVRRGALKVMTRSVRRGARSPAGRRRGRCSDRSVLAFLRRSLENNRLLNQLRCLPNEFPFLLQAIDLVRSIEKHASHTA